MFLGSVILGLDISKANFDAVLLDPPSAAHSSAKPRYKAFPNTQAGFERLQEWLGGRIVHACLEATNTYGDALARFLHAQGHTVSIVNPAQIKAFGGSQLSRTKTDKADAGRIAQFCLLHQPPPWTPPTPEAAALQALVRRPPSPRAPPSKPSCAALQALVRRPPSPRAPPSKPSCAALQALVRRPPSPRAPPSKPSCAALQALVRRLESLQEMRQMEQNRLDTSSPVVRDEIQDHIAYLAAQMEKTEQAIRDHIDQTPTLKEQRDLLVSIPGIAETTAAVVLAELLDVSQFTDARQVAAFAGLVPRLRQSSSSVRGRSCLSKVGSPRLRKCLYFPAMAALRFNPAIRALGARLKASGKCKMVIIGAAMRKLLCLAFGVLKSGRPFDANYSQNLAQNLAAKA